MLRWLSKVISIDNKKTQNSIFIVDLSWWVKVNWRHDPWPHDGWSQQGTFEVEVRSLQNISNIKYFFFFSPFPNFPHFWLVLHGIGLHLLSFVTHPAVFRVRWSENSEKQIKWTKVAVQNCRQDGLNVLHIWQQQRDRSSKVDVAQSGITVVSERCGDGGCC